MPFCSHLTLYSTRRTQTRRYDTPFDWTHGWRRQHFTNARFKFILLRLVNSWWLEMIRWFQVWVITATSVIISRLRGNVSVGWQQTGESYNRNTLASQRDQDVFRERARFGFGVGLEPLGAGGHHGRSVLRVQFSEGQSLDGNLLDGPVAFRRVERVVALARRRRRRSLLTHQTQRLQPLHFCVVQMNAVNTLETLQYPLISTPYTSR